MSFAIELLLLFLVLTNLALLGSARLGGCIRLNAMQGMTLSLLPLLLAHEGTASRLLGLAVVFFLLKGFVFPWLLFRGMRSADVSREVAPIVGYAASIPLGLVMLALSSWIASRLDLPRTIDPYILPLALSTMLTGLFLIIARRTAVMQVVGYLVLENGIYVFGLAIAWEQPFLVETGILLDIFAAVFVMGIAIFHISREFDHLEVDQMTSLKD